MLKISATATGVSLNDAYGYLSMILFTSGRRKLKPIVTEFLLRHCPENAFLLDPIELSAYISFEIKCKAIF